MESAFDAVSISTAGQAFSSDGRENLAREATARRATLHAHAIDRRLGLLQPDFREPIEQARQRSPFLLRVVGRRIPWHDSRQLLEVKHRHEMIPIALNAVHSSFDVSPNLFNSSRAGREPLSRFRPDTGL